MWDQFLIKKLKLVIVVIVYNVFVECEQVMDQRCNSADCVAGSDVGIRPLLYKHSFNRHGVSLHNSQQPSRRLYFCLPLPHEWKGPSLQSLYTAHNMIDKWFIWYSSQSRDWNNNQYSTIKSVQYYTRPRLIVISQAIGDKRIPKFISAGWDVFKSLSVVQTACHWWISFFRRQIVQAGRFAQYAVPEEPLSQLSAPQLEHVLAVGIIMLSVCLSVCNAV